MAENHKRSISDYFLRNAVPKRAKTSEFRSFVDDEHFECISPQHEQEIYAVNIPSTSNSNDVCVGEIIAEPSCSANLDEILDDKCRETQILLDIAKNISDGSQQSNLKMFPFRKFGVRNRNFQSSKYKSYPWLEYSAETDSAFYFACRMFASAHMKGTENWSFVNIGYSNWKRATENNSELKQHENSMSQKLHGVMGIL